MTAAEAQRLAALEGLVLVPNAAAGPNHPRYLGVSAHTDPTTNEVFFCASVIQGGTTIYLQDAHGNVKFTSDAEAALTFARYTAGRIGMDEQPLAPAMSTADAERLAMQGAGNGDGASYKHVGSFSLSGEEAAGGGGQGPPAYHPGMPQGYPQDGMPHYGSFGNQPALAYAARRMGAPAPQQHHNAAAMALAALPAQQRPKPKPKEPKEPKPTKYESIPRQPKAPPLSAYLCFAHATRLKLVEEAKAGNRADGDGPGQGGSSFSSAIERQLGKAWKDSGPEEKKKWEAVAADNRAKYTEECRIAGVEPKAFPHALLLPNRPDRVFRPSSVGEISVTATRTDEGEVVRAVASAAAAGGDFTAARLGRSPRGDARARAARPADADSVPYRWCAKSKSWVPVASVPASTIAAQALPAQVPESLAESVATAVVTSAPVEEWSPPISSIEVTTNEPPLAVAAVSTGMLNV